MGLVYLYQYSPLQINHPWIGSLWLSPSKDRIYNQGTQRFNIWDPCPFTTWRVWTLWTPQQNCGKNPWEFLKHVRVGVLGIWFGTLDLGTLHPWIVKRQAFLSANNAMSKCRNVCRVQTNWSFFLLGESHNSETGRIYIYINNIIYI